MMAQVDSVAPAVSSSEEGSKFDGHRRWLVRWWLDAARVVLPTLHHAHPIERLAFPT